MRVFRKFQDITDDCRGGVVVLGNFDGIHPTHLSGSNPNGGSSRYT